MFSNKVMVVDMTISLWSAKKYDEKVTAATTTQHKANNKAGRFNKSLINPDLLKPAQRARTALEAFVDANTVPWNRGGGRLLPTVKFMDFTAGVRPLKNEFENAVHNLLAKYPAEVLAAQTNLGDMYDPADYPDPADIKNKFGIVMDISPFPVDNDDWRQNMAQEEADEAAQIMKDTYERKERTMVLETYARARDVVQKMHDALSDPNKVFRDSLVGNVEALTSLLPAMNLTGDKCLDDIIVLMQTKLCVPPQRLRDDATLRANTAAAASTTLGMIAKGLT